MSLEQIAICYNGFYQRLMNVGLLVLALMVLVAPANAASVNTDQADKTQAQVDGVVTAVEEKNVPLPFNQKKARALIPEKRAVYDRLLFNELGYWNAGSHRHTIYTREAEWERMAADGHELSYWMLQIRSPTKESLSNVKALERLQELADQGDASAMCAYIWAVASPDGKGKEYAKAIEYIQRGAELGHPACKQRLGNLLIGVGASYLRGGLKVDVPRGYDLLISAARSGYEASGTLNVFFENKGFANKENIKRMYCWAYIDYAQFEQDYENDYSRTEAGVLRAANDYARKHNRQDLILLTKQLANTQPTVEQCIALGLK